MNLSDELEKSFLDEPAHRPVEQRIAAGRRLVLRRRLATGAGATAVAAVICGTAFALAGGGSSPSPAPAPAPTFATAPTASPEPADAPVDAGGPEGDLEWGREAAYLGTDGNLQIKPGWTVAERIDEPVGPGSVAVEVARGGRLQWFLWDGRGGEIVALGRPTKDGPPDPGFASFAAWVADVSEPVAGSTGEGRK